MKRSNPQPSPSFSQTYDRLKQAAYRFGERAQSRTYDHHLEATPPELEYGGSRLTREVIISTRHAPSAVPDMPLVTLTCDVTAVSAAGERRGAAGLAVEVGVRWPCIACERSPAWVRFFGMIASNEEAENCDGYWQPSPVANPNMAAPFCLRWYDYDDEGLPALQPTGCPQDGTGQTIAEALKISYTYREPFEPIVRAIDAGAEARPIYDPMQFRRLADFVLYWYEPPEAYE